MRNRSRWPILLVAAWWTLSGLVSAMQLLQMSDLEGVGVTASHALAISLTSSALWIPITLALFAWVRRFPVEARRWPTRIALQGIAVAAVIVFRLVAVVLLNPLVGWYAEIPDIGSLLWTSVWNNFFTSWIIVGVGHAVFFAERAAEREHGNAELRSRLDQARLQSLTAQINPHFLFNALNSIAELVHQDPGAADQALIALGELLRESLSDHRGMTTLAREIDLVERYLFIERLRLQERLSVDWSIDPDLHGFEVPTLVLQPLVENAIRHAISSRLKPGRIHVFATRQGASHMRIGVRDDGDAMTPQAESASRGAGIGLDNTRARLRCLYGPNASLTFSAHPDGGSIAEVLIPLSAAREDDHAPTAHDHRR